MKTHSSLVDILLFITWECLCYGKMIPMKVVEEPSSFGVNNAYNENGGASSSLTMRIQPSGFSGPRHLRALLGKCVESVINEYKYEVCPFSNVTQHEQSLRWNPYSGVLGVWQEWEIHNNTFVALVMREGDSCGTIFRSVKLLLTCGANVTPQIVSVSEPSTCAYEIVLNTSLVCHPHSMLVYPTLDSEYQRRWDEIEGKLQADMITPKGYSHLLGKVFEDAGLILSTEQHKELKKQAEVKDQSAPLLPSDEQLSNLGSCQEEYSKLKKEVDELKLILKQNNISTLASKIDDFTFPSF
ncbi:hypothetical protein CAPTEDRAFT_171631 [Capitella teleta]|uniref:Uncharacterized protein n=1 Tax=Capitella teleta TaxID=283909 RepID=R7UV01_CAPTE|nr:hypothetical protein CAPTEDRAFT_171631 [Capitella teleta]|eukprot:ELU09973.1 hypothetical protein CAPTEDRAFT_171631 [Capitella teleta]